MMHTLANLTADLVRLLAIAQHVCGRPLLRRVLDRETGTDITVAIPCGSTRDAVCPPCAYRSAAYRRQQCTEGWHLTHEPDQPGDSDTYVSNQLDDDLDDEDAQDDDLDDAHGLKRVRSTRRRQDVPDLPRLPIEDRTVGQVFTTASGKQYRPSMFLTVTLPFYGPVMGNGALRDPGQL